MVASVGPYRFSTIELGAAFAQSRATSTGSASPQKRLQRSVGNASGFRTPSRFMNSATDGTENQTERPARRMKSDGLSRSFSLGQDTHTPLYQATNRSKTDKSNVRLNVCERRSSAVMP